MIRSFEKRAEQKISGFQSPAADYLEGRLDIAQKLVVDPYSTFYFQMKGEAMASYSVHNGDILIIDRSLDPVHGAMVIAFYNGAFTCRMLETSGGKKMLRNDENVLSRELEAQLEIWGVVTSICRNVLPAILKTGRYKDVCAL